jgi:hypothetical protein
MTLFLTLALLEVITGVALTAISLKPRFIQDVRKVSLPVTTIAMEFMARMLRE